MILYTVIEKTNILIFPSSQKGDFTMANVKTRRGILFYLKRDWQLYLLLLFPITAVIIFKYIPLSGLVIAFKDYDVIKGFANSKWIGFDIFKEIFRMKGFYRVLRNTLVLNLLDLIVGFPAPIILAILLNEVKNATFKKISQTILYLPHFISWVIIGGIMYQLLSTRSGMLNFLLNKLGKESIPFLTERYHWVVTYVLVGVWQTMGWGTIIYLAAISGINHEYYEAATVDGAKRLAKIIYITIPCIRPTIVTLLILNLGRIMGSNFERVYSMGNPIVMEFSDVISTFVYNVGLKSYRYNVATAVGMFQSVVGFILVIIADRVAKRIGESGLI